MNNKLEIKNKLISKLYLEDSLSMAQIAKRLRLSPSTIRYWLDKSKTKRRSKADSINSWYQTQYNKRPFKLKTNISEEDEKLRIAGIMLYWGEGAKSGNVVKFTNSDPSMITLFLKFLRNICGIDDARLKAMLHLYPNLNEKELIELWAEKTNINKVNFYKPNIHIGKKGTYKNKSKFGTITINYPDKKLLEVILNWISEYKQ